MELLICGSGASEGIPALFCTCDLCKEAWKRGGKDRRTRTAYQLGEEICIDCGPDLMLHRERYGLHLEKLKHLFISHPHDDHFTPQHLRCHLHGEIAPAFLAEQTLTLHGTKQVMEIFHQAVHTDLASMRMALDELDPQFGCRKLENGMKFTFLWANHYCDGALNYIIELPDGFTLFIGTDSGIIQEKTWKILAQYQFDLMLLDGTAGALDLEGGHMTAKQVLLSVERMRNEKILRRDARLVANHFAHCAKMLHDDLEKFYLPHGIEPAYDGMRLPIGKQA